MNTVEATIRIEPGTPEYQGWEKIEDSKEGLIIFDRALCVKTQREIRFIYFQNCSLDFMLETLNILKGVDDG